MIYTVTTYSTTFHPSKSERTVRRMIKSKLLPENHIISNIGSHLFINVMTITEKAEYYLEKAIEYNLNKNKCISSVVKFCIENDLSVKLFCKIVGV